MKTFKRTVLPNGLRVITSPLTTESLTVLVLVGAGSRFEHKDISGIAHFLEHMFFKGAKKYKNAKDVSSAVDAIGGQFNAFTGKEYAGYYIKVASDQADTAYDVLSDMMLHATFDPAEIEKERGVILEEYNMYQDTPMYQIGWDFERLVFGDQPLGWDQIGTKETIKSVTQKDFRDFKNALYTPDNTVIIVAGNVKHDDVLEKVQKYFPFTESKKALEWKPFEGNTGAEKLITQNKKTEQGHIVLGFPGYNILHPDFLAQKVLSILLGGNMSSRMFLSVREAQGLCYYVHTSTDDYTDCGIISTRAGVDLTRTEDAITAIIKEYKKIVDEAPGEEELMKAKQYVKGKMILSLEDTESVAHLLGKRELLGEGVETLDEICAEVDKITADDVWRVAKDLFKSDNLRMAAIGPFADREQKFRDLLHF
jgi:predicted Zn-dependent peptidase